MFGLVRTIKRKKPIKFFIVRILKNRPKSVICGKLALSCGKRCGKVIHRRSRGKSYQQASFHSVKPPVYVWARRTAAQTPKPILSTLQLHFPVRISHQNRQKAHVFRANSHHFRQISICFRANSTGYFVPPRMCAWCSFAGGFACVEFLNQDALKSPGA